MSATLNTIVQHTDLHVTAEVPDFKDESASMHFMNIQKGGRALTLRVYGTTDSDLLVGKWGSSFFFKPAEDEIENLITLEGMIPHESVPKIFVNQKTLNKDYQLNIKLKTTKKDDQKFAFTGPLTPSSIASELTRGRKCVLELDPGFYFSRDPKEERYTSGLFYKLKSFKFDEEKPKAKGRK